MKHLRVEYNGIVLFDGGVDEVNWSDGPGGISVTGKFGKAAGGGGVAGGLMDLLTAASKKQTEAKIEEKRASLLVDSSDQEEASI
jgi:hypothetical protein